MELPELLVEELGNENTDMKNTGYVDRDACQGNRKGKYEML